MRSLVRVVVGMFLVVGALGAVGCQSGQGEHCQLSSDCESGYVCTSLGFCDTSNVVTADAAPAPDARQDAAAAADGSPTPDAAAPDATPIDAAPDAQ